MDKAQQRHTEEVFKALADKIAKDEKEAESAKDLAYAQTPKGRELEALRQDDLRALREHGSGKLPNFVNP